MDGNININSSNYNANQTTNEDKVRSVRKRTQTNRFGMSELIDLDERAESEDDISVSNSSDSWEPNGSDRNSDNDEEVENPAKKRRAEQQNTSNDDRILDDVYNSMQEHDEHHEQLVQTQTEVNVAKNNRDNADITASMSAGERAIFARILDMAVDIKMLKKQVTDHMVGNTSRTIRSIDKCNLVDHGLPLIDKESMDAFIKNLLKKEFRKNIVSVQF